MARLDDTTRLGNETGYADEFDVNGPYYGALEHEPLPQRRPVRRPRPGAVGDPPAVRARAGDSDGSSRRPTQIVAQLDAFGAASGRLDASRGYAAGYDFMTDGASSVRAALATSLTHGQRRAGRRHRADQRVDVDRRANCWPTSPAPPGTVGGGRVRPRRPHRARDARRRRRRWQRELAAALPTGRGSCSRWVATPASPSPTRSSAAARCRRRPARRDHRRRRRVRGHHRVRLRRPVQRRPPGAADDAVRRRTRRCRCRSATRCATPSRRTSPARACTAPTTRRRCRARSCTACRCSPSATSGRSGPCRRPSTSDPVAGAAGLFVDHRTTRTSRSPPAPTPQGNWFEADAGTGPQLPQITAGRPVQPRSRTRRHRRRPPTARCCRRTAPSSRCSTPTAS